MNKLLWCGLFAVVGTILAGCGQPSQPVAATPTSGTPSGVIAVAPDKPVKTIREKAGKGSGKQGRSLDQHEGIYVTPVKALFSTKEYLAYDIAVKHALDLFEAYEGRGPKSHEEFMERIIKDNNIKLPELPEGHKYVYDPMQKALMVEKPAP